MLKKNKTNYSSKKQQAIPGFLRLVEQTVSWLYEEMEKRDRRN